MVLETITMFMNISNRRPRLLHDADAERIDEPVGDTLNAEVTSEGLADTPNAEKINEPLPTQKR